MRHRTRIETLAKKLKPAYDMPIVLGFDPWDFEGHFSYNGVTYPMEDLEEVAMSLNIADGVPRIVGYVPRPEDAELVKQVENKIGARQGIHYNKDDFTWV